MKFSANTLLGQGLATESLAGANWRKRRQFAVNTFLSRESAGLRNPSSLNFISCSTNRLFMVTNAQRYISTEQTYL